jgi:epoxyqueuosine reductase
MLSMERIISRTVKNDHWLENREVLVTMIDGTVIIEKARSLGASLAGIASAEDLRQAPSYKAKGEPGWPAEIKSVLALALVHEEEKPELDWWDSGRDSEGNRKMARMAEQVAAWLKGEHEIMSHPLPYHVGRGGIYLKDAAALAGIGIIGQNNLLITPEYGPRVRLRGLFIEQDLKPSPVVDFDPCNGCDMPCRSACPRHAFKTGAYSRPSCFIQIDLDVENKKYVEEITDENAPVWYVKYCRACELACPVCN